MAPPTLIAHKSAFISTQTLHLSQALTPSSTWRTANQTAENGLSTRAVDDALYRLNHTLAQHARRVYAPQASRHVAEQIEGIFYEDAARAVRGRDEDDDDDEGDLELGEGRVRVGVDFASPTTIPSLPATWPNAREADTYPLEASRYNSLVSTLTSLSEQRELAQERVTKLKQISAMLAPFSTSNTKIPSTSTTSTSNTEEDETAPSVQENLITRNGDLERELERMRLLLARVAGRVAQLPSTTRKRKGGDEEDAEMDMESMERGKVGRLLDNL